MEDAQIARYVGMALKSVREIKKLTIEQLSEMSGVSVEDIASLEESTNEINGLNLATIMDVLSLPQNVLTIKSVYFSEQEESTISPEEKEILDQSVILIDKLLAL